MLQKWLEAISLKRASGVAMGNFIRDNIICRFGITTHLLSDKALHSLTCMCQNCLMITELIMWSPTLIILNETFRQKPLIRLCFVFLAGWSIMNIKDAIIFSLSPSGHVVSRSLLQLKCLSLWSMGRDSDSYWVNISYWVNVVPRSNISYWVNISYVLMIGCMTWRSSRRGDITRKTNCLIKSISARFIIRSWVLKPMCWQLSSKNSKTYLERIEPLQI